MQLPRMLNLPLLREIKVGVAVIGRSRFSVLGIVEQYAGVSLVLSATPTFFFPLLRLCSRFPLRLDAGNGAAHPLLPGQRCDGPADFVPIHGRSSALSYHHNDLAVTIPPAAAQYWSILNVCDPGFVNRGGRIRSIKLLKLSNLRGHSLP